MSDPAFDTLGAARKLKDAGVGADQAEAIVEVMGESTNRLVTTERFEAGMAMLRVRIESVKAELQTGQAMLCTRIDAVKAELQTGQAELHSRIDSVRAEMREQIARSQVATISVLIAAMALMFAIYGMLQAKGVIP